VEGTNLAATWSHANSIKPVKKGAFNGMKMVTTKDRIPKTQIMNFETLMYLHPVVKFIQYSHIKYH
jgi:hypothetical protein